MNPAARSFALRAFGLALAVACGGPWGCATRKTLAIRAMSDAQLHDEMGRMASSLRQTEEILLASQPMTPGDRDRIVDLLTALNVEVLQLDAKNGQLAHPDIADHLPELKATAAAALLDAKADPPRYYQLGRFSGICTECHSERL